MAEGTGKNTPTWGATIGVFVGCWFAAAACCMIVSLFVASGSGMTGYSRGGLSMIVIGAIAAGIYRSGSGAGPVVIGSAVAGAVIGFLAVQMSIALI